MKKNKIILFILLMFLSTNVYAYNWCKGGTGKNAYDICDVGWLRDFNDGTNFDMGINGSYSTKNNISFFRDFSSVGMNQNYDFWWNDNEDENGDPKPTPDREKDRATYLEKIEYSKVSTYYHEGMDTRLMIYGSDLSNGFYSNIYLIKNDSMASTFNSKVTVETLTYKDYEDTGLNAIPTEIQITVITMPVMTSTGGVSGKTNKVLVIKGMAGGSLDKITLDNFLNPTGSDRRKFTDKGMSNWPEEIYINKANVDFLSTSKGTNSVTLSSHPIANWCAGGTGSSYYNFCTIPYNGTQLKDWIKTGKTISSSTSFRFGPSSKVVENIAVSLYIYTYDSSSKTINQSIDFNKVLLNDSSLSTKFDNGVKVYSLSYTNLSNQNDYFNVYLYVTPIFDSNGNISSTKTNRLIYFEYNKNDLSLFNNIDASFCENFNKTSTSEWVKSLYFKDNKLSINYTYGATIYSTAKNVDTNWCKGGTGKNIYDFCDVPIWNDNKVKNRTNGKPMTYVDGGVSYSGYSVFDKPNKISPSNFKDILNSDNIKYRPQIRMNRNLFSNKGTLVIFKCDGTKCASGVDNIAHIGGGSLVEHYDIYTNVGLLTHPEFRELFDSKVSVKTKDYLSSAEGDITITGVYIPIIEEDGTIEHSQFMLRAVNKKSPNQVYEFTAASAAAFEDFNKWPDIISTDKKSDSYSVYQIASDKSKGVKFYRDGFNQEAFDIDLDTSECAGAPGIKAFIEDYLVKGLHIIAPILLFILTTVDLASAVMGKDGKGLNKAANSFMKRAIVFILIFFAGNILDLIFDLAGIERCQTVDTDGDIVEEVYPTSYYEYYIEEYDD